MTRSKSAREHVVLRVVGEESESLVPLLEQSLAANDAFFCRPCLARDIVRRVDRSGALCLACYRELKHGETAA